MEGIPEVLITSPSDLLGDRGVIQGQIAKSIIVRVVCGRCFGTVPTNPHVSAACPVSWCTLSSVPYVGSRHCQCRPGSACLAQSGVLLPKVLGSR